MLFYFGLLIISFLKLKGVTICFIIIIIYHYCSILATVFYYLFSQDRYWKYCFLAHLPRIKMSKKRESDISIELASISFELLQPSSMFYGIRYSANSNNILSWDTLIETVYWKIKSEKYQEACQHLDAI